MLQIHEVARLAEALTGVRRTTADGLAQWQYHGRLVARQLDVGGIGIQARGQILCAHADHDGQGMHWKLPGQACTATAERNAETEAGQ